LTQHNSLEYNVEKLACLVRYMCIRNFVRNYILLTEVSAAPER